MGWPSALAIWALFWFLTLFAVLPWGVRTDEEAGVEHVPGSAESAPVNPMLGAKLAWTTIIATVLFGLFWANYLHGWVRVEDVPGWRHFDR